MKFNPKRQEIFGVREMERTQILLHSITVYKKERAYLQSATTVYRED